MAAPKSNYKRKVTRQGKDSYGTWREGQRQSAERIAGTVINSTGQPVNY